MLYTTNNTACCPSDTDRSAAQWSFVVHLQLRMRRSKLGRMGKEMVVGVTGNLVEIITCRHHYNEKA
jgi:hypothetical protein